MEVHGAHHSSLLPLNHRDALRAQEVVAGGMNGILKEKDLSRIEYQPLS